MTLDHRQHHMENVRDILSVVVYPIRYLVHLPSAAGDWLSESVSTRRTLLEENRSLRAQRLVLESQLQKLEALEAENMRLRDLLDSAARIDQRVLIAELLAVDMAPFSRQIMINKGRRDDVRRGQPLLEANGVMGQVVEVGPFSSSAMLITDPSHGIPVEINRNGLRAVAQGTGESNRLDLSHLPSNADVEVNDLLVTSGLGGRFPPGYPVGRITRVERHPDQPFAEVRAEPTARLESTRVILLVMGTFESRDSVTEGPETTAQGGASE